MGDSLRSWFSIAILFSEECPGVLQKPGLRLVISNCAVSLGDIDVLVGHVSRGDNLVRFQFENEFEHGDGEDHLGFDKLVKHLKNHNQLEFLSIVGARLTPPVISDIASMLRKPDSKLVGLELAKNGAGDNEFKTIVESLSTNKTLLGLSCDNTSESVLLIDRLLSLKDLRLKMLSTSCMAIDDSESAMLSKASRFLWKFDPPSARARDITYNEWLE